MLLDNALHPRDWCRQTCERSTVHSCRSKVVQLTLGSKLVVSSGGVLVCSAYRGTKRMLKKEPLSSKILYERVYAYRAPTISSEFEFLESHPRSKRHRYGILDRNTLQKYTSPESSGGDGYERR